MKQKHTFISDIFATYPSYVELSLLSNQKSTVVEKENITYLLTNLIKLL